MGTIHLSIEVEVSRSQSLSVEVLPLGEGLLVKVEVSRTHGLADYHLWFIMVYHDHYGL